jgi:hypothetical protein
MDLFGSMFPYKITEIRILFVEGEKQVCLHKTRYVNVNNAVENSAMGEGMLY